MKAIVGLGNPGKEYKHTRHNIGWLVLEELCKEWKVILDKRRYYGKVGRGKLEGVEFILLAPYTYMNNSGKSVKVMKERLALATENILVVHDAVDLAFGIMKLRRKGSSGGHKGIQSIIDSLNTELFGRLKIGISRPQNGKDLRSYVLEEFTIEEKKRLPEIINNALKAISIWLLEGMDKAMSQIN